MDGDPRVDSSLPAVHREDGIADGWAGLRHGHADVRVVKAQASAEVADLPGGKQVVIVCSHEASHFLLLPQYEALREALGEQVMIRVLTYHYDMKNLPREPAADVVLGWEATLGAEDRVELFGEAVRPLCSPGYAQTHANILNGPLSGWGGLTFLDLTRPNEGWFRVAGRPERTPRYIGFDNYTYLLEAAAAGHGIMLGWRHCIERYIDTAALVELADRFVEFDNRYCGALTAKGRRNPAAHKCLQFLKLSAGFRSAQTIPNSQL